MIRLPRRPVRYLSLLALATGTLLVPAAPASAAARVVNLDCTITVSNDLHPGLTPQLRHIAIVSHGLTGTATCTGTVNGQPVTGPIAIVPNGDCFTTPITSATAVLTGHIT